MYVFDYGAPKGFSVTAHPERIGAISQNKSASEEGLSDGWKSSRRDPVDRR
jgi:hypothetical protein